MPRQRATSTPTQGRFVLAGGPSRSRLIAYMVGKYLHAMERERRVIYHDDLDVIRVAETIGLAGIEPGMSDATFRAAHGSFESVVGVARQHALNATSIASATGISRETVRRKLKLLLRAGFIVEKGRASYVLKPGVLQAPARQAAFARGLEETVRLMNAFVEQGMVRWVADGKAKRK